MYSATTNVLNLFLKIILKYCIYNVHVGVSDLRQVRSVVSPGTPGTTNKKLTAIILNIVESGIKHHKPKPNMYKGHRPGWQSGK